MSLFRLKKNKTKTFFFRQKIRQKATRVTVGRENAERPLPPLTYRHTKIQTVFVPPDKHQHCGGVHLHEPMGSSSRIPFVHTRHKKNTHIGNCCRAIATKPYSAVGTPPHPFPVFQGYSKLTHRGMQVTTHRIPFPSPLATSTCRQSDYIISPLVFYLEKRRFLLRGGFIPAFTHEPAL